MRDAEAEYAMSDITHQKGCKTRLKSFWCSTARDEVNPSEYPLLPQLPNRLFVFLGASNFPQVIEEFFLMYKRRRIVDMFYQHIKSIEIQFLCSNQCTRFSKSLFSP